MKRVYLFRAALIIAVLVVIGYMSLHLLSIKVPKGADDIYADVLGRKIELATGKADFDNFRYLRWTSPGSHHFVWDKTKQLVVVEFSDYMVLLNLSDRTSSMVFEEGEKVVKPGDKQKIIEKAYSHFCNDSFWLIAPFKLFDEGVKRQLVTQGSQQKLLISYESGGVTPGDQYLWHFNKDFLPTGVQMWTSKVLLDGIYFSWENYKTLSGDAKIALTHKFGFLNIGIEDLEAGNNMTDLKLEVNPFLAFD
jgi:hypothetical protein